MYSSFKSTYYSLLSPNSIFLAKAALCSWFSSVSSLICDWFGLKDGLGTGGLVNLKLYSISSNSMWTFDELLFCIFNWWGDSTTIAISSCLSY